jgi:hypothetical protein
MQEVAGVGLILEELLEQVVLAVAVMEQLQRRQVLEQQILAVEAVLQMQLVLLA